MDYIFSLVLILHLAVGLGVVVLVLLQHGKGADMGAAFGSGSSGSLFGATGSANFLSRTTALLATIFFVTSMTLTYMATARPEQPKSVMEGVEAQVAPVAPVPVDGSKSQEIPR